MRTAWLVLALALCSCKQQGAKEEQEDNARKLTAESTVDATEPIVDEDYRFELRWPGKGWKLMGEADAQQLVPGAVAGAVHDDAPTAVVVIEEIPGLSLDAAGQLMGDKLLGENVALEDPERVTIAGKPGLRIEAETTINDARFRYVIFGFVHQDHLFQIQSWSLVDRFRAGASDALAGAFVLLDGEIKGRLSKVPPLEAAGVGWIVEAGKYRSAISGLEIDPPQGWRVVVEDELRVLSADAEVGLLHERPDIYLTATTQTAPKKDRAAFESFLRQQFKEGAGVSGEPEIVERNVGAARTKMQRYRTDIIAWEHGLHFHGDRVLELHAWCYDGLVPRADKPIGAALSSIKVMDPARRAALRAELVERPSPQFVVGRGWSVRGSVYRDFANGITWTAPKGAFWRLGGGELARAMNPAAVLSIEELERGVFGLIMVSDFEVADAEEWHTSVEEVWEWPASERTDVALAGGVAGRMSMATGELGSVPADFVFVTAIRGSQGFALTLGGPAPLRERKLVEQVVAGLELSDPLPETTQEGVYIDHRFGFAFTPVPGFTMKDQTSEALQGMGRVVTMKKDRGFASVEVVSVPTMGDTAWLEAFLEQTLRDRFSELMASGAPQRSQVTVAGRPARKLIWSKPLKTLEAVIFRAGPRVLILIVENVDDEIANAFFDSVRMLD